MKVLVGAVACAATVAACFTFGLEALHAARHAGAPLQTAEDVAGTAEATDPNLAVLPKEGQVFTSERNASAFQLARSALSTEVLLFRRELLGGNNSNFTVVRKDVPAAAEIADPVIALPRPRPAAEMLATPNVGIALNSPGPGPDASPSSMPRFFEKLFRFKWKDTPQFPNEASGRTAVYDLETRAVYMPTGEILEAHSGFGEHMDDARYIQVKMRGPTPPNVYALSMREKPFHGVQAIRLTPLGNSQMFGRAGILAHPYMLGPNGQSNGCVSIQDYPKFLEAYQKGQVDRLIVVPSLAATPDVISASVGSSVRRASL